MKKCDVLCLQPLQDYDGAKVKALRVKLRLSQAQSHAVKFAGRRRLSLLYKGAQDDDAPSYRCHVNRPSYSGSPPQAKLPKRALN